MTRLEMLRAIVAGRQCQKIRIDGRKVYVDLFTASMLCQVHDALSPANQAKFLALPLLKMVNVGWKLTKAAA